MDPTQEPNQEAHEDSLYYKIFDTMLVLKDVSYIFKTYSATNIKNLISSKLKAKKRGPKDLQALYNLEMMIRNIREEFIIAKNEINYKSPDKPQDESPDESKN
jgi:hypothetical protein